MMSSDPLENGLRKMKRAARLRWVAASVAVVGLCLPQPLLAGFLSQLSEELG